MVKSGCRSVVSAISHGYIRGSRALLGALDTEFFRQAISGSCAAFKSAKKFRMFMAAFSVRTGWLARFVVGFSAGLLRNRPCRRLNSRSQPNNPRPE